MNDISKTQTVSRLNKAIESEGLKIVEAAACIGIRDTYISMMRNIKSWGQCPLSAWEAALLWVNSGQTLKEYSEKHGKVLPPVKHVELPPKVIAVKPPARKPFAGDKPKVFTETLKWEKVEDSPDIKEKIEVAERLSKHPYFSGEPVVNSSKICIDIEINLIINGKKITL